MSTQPNASAEAWTLIEEEKRRDRLIKRISVIAWTVTFIVVLIIGIGVGYNVSQLLKLLPMNSASWTAVIWAAMPLIVIIGALSLLIATLSTVGVFLRLRTASLAEIQLRLAALEDMLAERR
jgi:uncharacterized BrkB/YihY/UPF0761 family membrane protein